MTANPKMCIASECDRKAHARGYCTKHYWRFTKNGDASIALREVNFGTPSERFWMKVTKGPGCWEWTGSKNADGYGNFTTRSKGKTWKAHRFAYTEVVGPIPDGMVIDHICHNLACVRPDHLRPATPKQNGENRLGARKDNRSTGVLGVKRTKQGTYYTYVTHNGVRHTAGTFTDLSEAEEAVKQLRLRLYTHNDLDRIPA